MEEKDSHHLENQKCFFKYLYFAIQIQSLYSMIFKKILIAVNDDDYALKPIETGFALAQTLQAEVALIFVIDQRLLVSSLDTGDVMLGSIEVLKREAKTILRNLTNKFSRGMPVQHFTPEGRPTTEILNKAKEWDADLIVMGTHGRAGLLQLFAGSISSYIKQHAQAPVLIVPTKE